MVCEICVSLGRRDEQEPPRQEEPSTRWACGFLLEQIFGQLLSGSVLHCAVGSFVRRQAREACEGESVSSCEACCETSWFECLHFSLSFLSSAMNMQ